MKKYAGIVEVAGDCYTPVTLYVQPKDDHGEYVIRAHIREGGCYTMAEAMEKARKHLKEE